MAKVTILGTTVQRLAKRRNSAKNVKRDCRVMFSFYLYVHVCCYVCFTSVLCVFDVYILFLFICVAVCFMCV